MPLEDSCRKFLVSWKMSLFYYKTVFWPTEINMRNCLLNLIKNCLAAFLNDASTIFHLNLLPNILFDHAALYWFQAEIPVKLIWVVLPILLFLSINSFIGL